MIVKRMWVVCLMREGWAVRQREKCRERIVLMIVACRGRIKKKKMYNWREMDSLSCSQCGQHSGKCVAEPRSDATAGCRGPGIEGRRSRSGNCTAGTLQHVTAMWEQTVWNCQVPKFVTEWVGICIMLGLVLFFSSNVMINKMYFSVKDTLQVSLQSCLVVYLQSYIPWLLCRTSENRGITWFNT